MGGPFLYSKFHRFVAKRITKKSFRSFRHVHYATDFANTLQKSLEGLQADLPEAAAKYCKIGLPVSVAMVSMLLVFSQGGLWVALYRGFSLDPHDSVLSVRPGDCNKKRHLILSRQRQTIEFGNRDGLMECCSGQGELYPISCRRVFCKFHR